MCAPNVVTRSVASTNAEFGICAQKQKERLMEQILELQTTTKVSYDLHINSEFERLRTESQQQLELIKQHHREVLERETRVLREAKDEACRQAEELRKQLAQVESSRQDLTLRLAKIESEQDGRVAELQSEVKVKTFELNQVKSTLETKLARARQYEVELDMAKEELNIHKRQFVILEQESSAEIRNLTSALAAANEKVQSFQLSVEIPIELALRVVYCEQLQAYESLEAEIDKSIVRMGKENNPAALKTNASTVQWSVHNLPSIAQRRTQQALHLAQQLHQKEAEVSECNQRLRRLQLALEEANSKRSLVEKALERSHHPTQYLIHVSWNRTSKFAGTRRLMLIVNVASNCAPSRKTTCRCSESWSTHRPSWQRQPRSCSTAERPQARQRRSCSN